MKRGATTSRLAGTSVGLLLMAGLAAGRAGAQTGTPRWAVQAEMRHVDFHVDASIVLRISYLRGRLLPRTSSPVSFDDKASFILAMDTARVGLSTSGIAALLNRYVFGYDGAPLRGLSVGVEDGRLKLKGRMNGTPFSIRSDVRITPAGELQLVPASIKALGIPVRGVMRLLGLRLAKMLDLRKAQGIRVVGNDLFIDPATILPPPLTRGHLVAVELRDSSMIQVFRPVSGAVPAPLTPPDSTVTNYMYFREGSLRFGRLTMTPADLFIIDADPGNPFEFFLDRYLDQLVAGFSRNTRTGGLITTMPDLHAAGTPLRTSMAAGGSPPQ